MPLEKLVTVIADLDATSPGPAEPKSQGDDHIRNLKTAVKNCFPGFAGAVLIGGVANGAADAYTLSPGTPLLAYAANALAIWMPHITNLSGAVTLNVSGLGPRAVRSVSGGPLQSGDLVAGQYVAMVDTGSEFRLIGVTKNYVDNLAFNSMLPTPPVVPGRQFLVYENGVFGYLANATPDFLLQSQGII